MTNCDGMTDASGAQMVKLFGVDMPKLGVLNVNNMHDMEHYGNLVVHAAQEHCSTNERTGSGSTTEKESNRAPKLPEHRRYET
jgi:hypothetical protein